MKRKQRTTKLLLPGDILFPLGMVDTNHCGFPWPVGYSEIYYGTVSVISVAGPIFCDALTGKELTKKEQLERINNEEFDYEKRWSECKTWRKVNGRDEQRGMRKVTKGLA